MTMTTSMQRSQIVIPAQGLIEIRDTLTDLLKEYGTDDKGCCMLLFQMNTRIVYLLCHMHNVLFILSLCSNCLKSCMLNTQLNICKNY